MEYLEQETFQEPDDITAVRGGPLIIHGRPTRSAKGLVIFVHGLGGRAYGEHATWGYFPRFVYEDFPSLDVGLYSYRTLSGRIQFWKSIEIEDEAVVLAHVLRDVAAYDSVVLVGHSMGGLLCEASIAHLVETRQNDAMLRICGMLLIATPQVGSLRVPAALNWLKDFAALRPHNRLAQRTHQALNNYVALDGSRDKPFCVPTWAIVGAHDMWVDRLSSQFNLPDARIKMVRASHTSLVKPSSKSDDAYRFVHDCIRKAFADAAERKRASASDRRSVTQTPMPVFRTEALERLVATLQLDTSVSASGGIVSALVGQPGQGLTTLAAALAHHAQVEKHLPEGALWVTLGDEPDILSYQSMWGTQFGADLTCYDSPAVRTMALRILLSRKRMLLVIDDVRRAADAQPFLAGGPDCRTLITTRDPAVAAALAGENVLKLDSLPSPAPVELLRQLAPEGMRSNRDTARLLAGGLPQNPLELNLLARILEQAPTVLNAASTQAAPTDMGRLAYMALPDDTARGKFRALAVFGAKPLSFTASAAAVVWEVAVEEAERITELLEARGLIDREPDQRITLHEALCRHASALLAEAGEAAAAQLAHARYYLAVAQSAAENESAVERELEQIKRGFRFAEMLGQAEIILGYAVGMGRFLIHRGLTAEARAWIQSGLRSAGELGRIAEQARLQRMLGQIHLQAADPEQALSCFEKALSIAASLADDRERLRVLLNIGLVHENRRNWPTALACYEQARALAERISDRLRLAQALRATGFVRRRLKEWDEALRCYEESAGILRALGEDGPHLMDLAHTLDNLGELYVERSDYARALDYHQQSLAVHERAGDRAGAARCHIAIGENYARSGDSENALRHCQESLRICEQIADIRGMSISLGRVGDLLNQRGERIKAETFQQESQRLRKELMETTRLAAPAS